MISQAAILAQASGMDWVTQHSDWVVAGLIVFLGLFVYGFGDVLRISIMRIRAVASVCFRESIRRRVLWLTPLAIIGVLIVSQFQRPLDEQDAIRQVTKFCIFSAGILVTIASVILACTNLPREIENRVIYTIVTKPISRLEILLGKIAGFAGTSAAILLIMGLFTWGYLQVHEWRVLKDIDARLEAGGLEPSTEQTLAYYKKIGLLDARRYVGTSQVQVYPEYPKDNTDVRIIEGGEQDAMVPFVIGDDVLPQGTTFEGLAIVLRLPWEQRLLTKDEVLSVTAMAEELGIKVNIPALPAVPGAAAGTDLSQSIPAFFRISFLGSNMEPLAEATEIQEGKPHIAPDRTGAQQLVIAVPSTVAERLANSRRFYLHISGGSPGTRYVIDPQNIAVVLATQGGPVSIPSRKIDPAAPSQVVVLGRSNQNGQQVHGNAQGKGAVGVFSFDQPTLPSEQIDFEFKPVVERDADDLETPAFVSFVIRNTTSGKTSDAVLVAVESRRTAHFSLPAEYAKGGKFDVLVQAMTPNQWLSLRPVALRLSSPDQGFAFNLLKSFFILWLFSILVITVAIFCSTFLSWPIAFVLTLLILLGHWGVIQLGDLASAGVGRQIVGDLFAGAAPAVAETLNRSVEGLGALLRIASAILPDISQFAAMEDIEQGVAISAAKLGAPLSVLALFGLPILTLSYVFFRNKEVAP